MIVEEIRKGLTNKLVQVHDIPVGTSRDEVINFALDAAGETRDSLYGIRFSWVTFGSLGAVIRLDIS